MLKGFGSNFRFYLKHILFFYLSVEKSKLIYKFLQKHPEQNTKMFKSLFRKQTIDRQKAKQQVKIENYNCIKSGPDLPLGYAG